MKHNDLIYRATEKAAILHSGQTRKDGVTPFIAHPFCVGFLLFKYTKDEEVVAAGILHDVLEDVEGYEHEDMERDFGKRVAKIVSEVSHRKDASWREAREEYLEVLKRGSEEAVMVSVADKIHNIASHIDGVEKYGNKFWNSFSCSSPKEHKWFYESVLEIATERLDSPIVGELKAAVNRANNFIFEGI